MVYNICRFHITTIYLFRFTLKATPPASSSAREVLQQRKLEKVTLEKAVKLREIAALQMEVTRERKRGEEVEWGAGGPGGRGRGLLTFCMPQSLDHRPRIPLHGSTIVPAGPIADDC